jgi:hypothetical protein
MLPVVILKPPLSKRLALPVTGLWEQLIPFKSGQPEIVLHACQIVSQ